MCGLAGILSNKHKVDYDQIQPMIDSLTHRGPDDDGIYTNHNAKGNGVHDFIKDGPSVGLGHRRLSIIDLSTGKQPIHNEDGSVWIVFNGEIYNFLELRSELLKDGHTFYTSTDTETIIHLYEKYGDNCVQHLRGMFVFAIWDQNDRKLLVARDRLGIKPLYYTFLNGTLLFGSELKAISTNREFQKELSKDGILHYFQFGYIPDPLSIYENVYKLPPGNILTFQNEKLEVTRYWNLDFSVSEMEDETKLMDQFLEMLKESVRIRLISDVPLGAFLSGGLDSSTVVALMALSMDMPVKTFSIGFEEEEFNELPYAREVARYLGAEHHEMTVRPSSFDLIYEIINQFDEPFGDPSAIPTYYVSKLAREHVKVVLSGDGGDELFGGYDSYAVTLNRNRFQAIPLPIRTALNYASRILPSWFYGKNFLYNVTLPTALRFVDYVSHISKNKHNGLLNKELYERLKQNETIYLQHLKETVSYSDLAKLQYIDMKTYLPGDILVKVDRMSMIHSLEARVPLLDHKLVEFVCGLPTTHKINGKIRKFILKKVAYKLLPIEIIERKKQGFGVPLEYWFQDDLQKFIQEILFDQQTIQRGYFDLQYLNKIISDQQAGKKENTLILWHLIVFELWNRMQ